VERLAELIEPNRALLEAARIAYSDIREVFDAQGRLRPINDWPDDLAAAVGSVEVVRRNVDSGDNKTDDVIKVRCWDKPKALEMLFKHLGLLLERMEVTVTTSIEDRLKAGRDRLAKAKHGDGDRHA
jgi:phage terminase small subunit